MDDLSQRIEQLRLINPELASELEQQIGLLIAKAPKPKPKHKVKSPRFEKIRFNNYVLRDVDRQNVIKHFMETCISEINNMPSWAIKAQVVKLCEILAQIEPESEVKKRNYWRMQAAHVVMIDKTSSLIKYVVSMATSIK